ncbi:hypothetical protein GCM10018785_56040 [Streptomyces longispororuber]|uniref:Secreted protein n=1 Tax=Streptomyces longispororuber TaxID=68230 RepID=A0A918ZZL9_9ACTN|nr:hypothetical protein [Streptomyces longispororuber]GHE80770.1 hypothetical protein GCM10018785_56040 [Streptomyces longispororuber]
MRIRTGAAAAALAGLLAVGAAVPAQADSGGAARHSGTAVTQAARAGSGVGMFQTMGDNVHFSHTVRGTINAHGWWKNLRGPAGIKAKVTVWLQVKRGGEWKTLTKAAKDVYSGGGSGKRTAAAYKCTYNVGQYDFRSVIDVDLIGYADDSYKKITPTQRLGCGL